MTGRARGVVLVACVLLVVVVLVPAPAPAAAVPVEIAPFATQIAATEEKTPNF